MATVLYFVVPYTRNRVTLKYSLFLSLYISFFLSALKRILIIVEEDKIEKGVWGKRKRRGIAKEE